MQKIKNVTIVSLSRGIMGEPFMKHELDIGLARMKALGLNVTFAENAMKGMEYIAAHPEARAKDLLDAFESDADMILCAIGGDDTYRLLPYLFSNNQLKNAVKEKVFLGFSDTTVNHLMLHKVGLNTFYGQAFLPDICELDKDMLAYSKKYFTELIETGTISKITPSDIWYDTREDFSVEAVGTSMPSHENEGFVLLQGQDGFEGEILGGCIDTIFDIFNGERYADSPQLCAQYGLFPTLEDWKGKILLLESSEERPDPSRYRKMLEVIKEQGVFDVVSGVLIGKPYNEQYFEEYKVLLKEIINDPSLPVVVNINVGHANPRCIIPFGVHARVSVADQEITFDKAGQ